MNTKSKSGSMKKGLRRFLTLFIRLQRVRFGAGEGNNIQNIHTIL